jgi:hypothetical protein
VFGFTFDKRLTNAVKRAETLEGENETLRQQIAEAKGQLADLKATKQAEENEIKHGLKMERERMDLEKQKHEAKCEREKESAIALVKDQYRDKMENELREQIKRGESLYKEILGRLPDVNVKLRGTVK